MIEQVLNRQFVLDQLRAVRLDLQSAASEEPSSGSPSGLELPAGDRGLGGHDGRSRGGADDFVQALEDVARAEHDEAEESSGQEGFAAPSNEAPFGTGPSELDRRSFFSRNPVVNLLQSALDEYLELHHGEELSSSTPADTLESAGGQVAVTDRSLPGWAVGGDLELLGRYEPADIRWISSALAMGIRKFRGRHPFNTTPAEPVVAGERARLLLVGDWGSGLPRARKVAGQMRRVLDEGKAAGLEQHVVHLGDVYYSGWKREYQTRFLDPWPVHLAEAETIGSWSLNANHDMYSGGHDYYDYLLADARFARQQRSSFFSIVSSHWQVMGLDTGWKEGDLQDPQADWVHEAARDGSGRKLLLLSHHQPYSPYEKGSPVLLDKLGATLSTGRVDAWFWGHEHRCLSLRPHLGVAQGRCIGHGGIPVYQWHDDGDPTPAPVRYEHRGAFREGLERWALFGFAVLDLDGPRIQVRYIDENGLEHHREVLE